MAATDFHVNGPTVVKWAPIGSALEDLGFTDNDDLIRITSSDHRRTYTRVDGGDMIAEAVMGGTTGTLDMTLVSYDETELSKLISRCRTGSVTSPSVAMQGLISTVGGQVVTSRLIRIQIYPKNIGADIYDFPYMMLTAGPEYIDLGNAVKRVSLSFTSVWADDTLTHFVDISNRTS